MFRGFASAVSKCCRLYRWKWTLCWTGPLRWAWTCCIRTLVGSSETDYLYTVQLILFLYLNLINKPPPPKIWWASAADAALNAYCCLLTG